MMATASTRPRLRFSTPAPGSTAQRAPARRPSLTPLALRLVAAGRRPQLVVAGGGGGPAARGRPADRPSAVVSRVGPQRRQGRLPPGLRVVPLLLVLDSLQERLDLVRVMGE